MVPSELDRRSATRDFLVGVYRYNVRVQAHVGLLTHQYPPFTLSAG